MYVPISVPQSTPSFTYDASDVGGFVYLAYSLVRFNGSWTEEEMPWVPHNSGSTGFLLVTTFKAPPVLKMSTWNCTAKKIAFADKNFFGRVNSQVVCGAGNCCVDYIGNVKFTADDVEGHSTVDQRVNAGFCGDIPEEVYCHMVAHNVDINCLEYYTAPNERLVIFPCFDSYVLFGLTCKVFQTVYGMIDVMEPPLYLSTLTNEEVMVVDSVFALQDRLCHPHSYYVPTAVSDSISQPSSTSSGISMEAVVAFSVLLLA